MFFTKVICPFFYFPETELKIEFVIAIYWHDLFQGRSEIFTSTPDRRLTLLALDMITEAWCIIAAQRSAKTDEQL